MKISPRHADILAHADLTDQDIADYASFASDDEAEQAAIVQQIRDARTA
ncbi:hypothetical protein MF672_038875 [Actinomadura sp. ATCC 31491]|uniref:DUF1778 domain-containing protein n=1 Tax=Actinomadura luzonensis TaxID=2805427 RepID=A0ABT0G6I9_9ACTN|nr:hypothetical protein [Actinomadura luzonensis]MCK2219718.1 hypothetical protein [Actinomadura luzonensis]